MNSYELSRNWFDYSFCNPEKIKPIHSAVYFFAIEHCNRLGWKEKFGFPSQMVMEAVGVKNWRTYSKALNDLVDWGFIKMIETSKNQYSANIIAIVENTKALDKALDKALQKHSIKQSKSTVSIDKQYNNITKNNITVENKFSFKKSLLDFGFNSDLIKDWLEVRKIKKARNTETAFKGFIREVNLTGLDKNEVLRQCVERSWSGLKAEWIIKNVDNGTTTKKTRGISDEDLNKFINS